MWAGEKISPSMPTENTVIGVSFKIHCNCTSQNLQAVDIFGASPPPCSKALKEKGSRS